MADYEPQNQGAHAPRSPESDRPIGLWTGTLLVIANMVGVGVFITTGELLQTIQSGPAVLVAWFLGGVASLCGALCYAELGAALPRNGGEYLFLSRAFHPAVGFLSGWVSSIAGFCAPLALVAWAFQAYLHAVFPALDGVPAGIGIIALCSVLHAMNVRGGHAFQNVFTGVKVALILGFIVLGLLACKPALITASGRPFVSSLMSPSFAVGLISIYFAYSGWNAAAYVAGEFRDPHRELPLSLVLGTTLVTLLYLALNFVFLAAAPAEALINARSEDISTLGHTAAIHLFGPQAGRGMSLLILLGLISSVGAFLVAGSRMMEAVAERQWGLQWLAVRRSGGGPVGVIIAQAVGAMILMQTGNALTLLIWVGLTLSLFSFSTVLAVFILRFREPDLPRPYRTWGYPVTPLVYLLLQGWVIVQTVWQNPRTALASSTLLAAGLMLYIVLYILNQTFAPDSRLTPTESAPAAAPAEPPSD
jgi:APA family basic amino acid/polyamine antiporter